MVLRRKFLSLETLAITRLSQLSFEAIKSALILEETSKSNERQHSDNKYKRKRSYSSGDQTQGEIQWHKKLRTRENPNPEVIATNKRPLDDDDDSDDCVRSHKCSKLEGKSERNQKMKEQNSGPRALEMSRDDTTVKYLEKKDSFHTIRQYFLPLPHSLWSQYSKMLINHTLKLISLGCAEDKIIRKVVEYILCEKLTSFSTRAIESYGSELEGTVYDKLRHCRQLVSLEVTMKPREERDVVAAVLSLQRLRLLQMISLLPPERYSFHWALREVTQHCRALHGLKIVYNGDLFSNADDLVNLTRCTSLTSLWLFNFGRRSETIQVSRILKFLKNLKVLFHKELPNAILELPHTNETDNGNRSHGSAETGQGDQGLGESDIKTEQESQQTDVRQEMRGVEGVLELERVDLCWHQRGLGYQLVYVPSSYLVHLAHMCPKVTLLNLVGPPCLVQVFSSLDVLKVLVLQQTSLASCLTRSLHRLHLSGLTELLVSDVCDVTHDLVSAVACGCPNLRVLSVTNSSLEARGDLVSPPHRVPFPNLQQVTLVPTMLQDRPGLTTPVIWKLGKHLTHYIVDDTLMLVALHIQYKVEDLSPGDTPTQRDFEDILSCSRPNLHTLVLEWPPSVSPSLVERVLVTCPALTTLGAITTWPITTHQRDTLITRHAYSLNIT
ncbi:hypothetical protein Pcinc_014680 [Petrolisthes cinctipes]|uniref:Uncharacterized protein n=2 Tax=Petrolisthes cinctipes TaxID=88211 RepID=A0AAE1FWH6_PETCI|nr:hypothetical protein Pcinc_014680 [Petrolisthes cinctipes]